MFQVLVKTTALMNGAYTFLLGSREEREQFVKRPDVFWYHFPEEDEDWRWHRGGAWKPSHQLTPEEQIVADLAQTPFPGVPGAVTVQDADEADDRWLARKL